MMKENPLNEEAYTSRGLTKIAIFLVLKALHTVRFQLQGDIRKIISHSKQKVIKKEKERKIKAMPHRKTTTTPLAHLQTATQASVSEEWERRMSLCLFSSFRLGPL